MKAKGKALDPRVLATLVTFNAEANETRRLVGVFPDAWHLAEMVLCQQNNPENAKVVIAVHFTKRDVVTTVEFSGKRGYSPSKGHDFYATSVLLDTLKL